MYLVLFLVHVCVLRCVWLFMTPWTAAHQAFLSTGFSRQEYWSGLPFPTPGDLSNPGIKPTSPPLAGGATWEAPSIVQQVLRVSCRF